MAAATAQRASEALTLAQVTQRITLHQVHVHERFAAIAGVDGADDAMRDDLKDELSSLDKMVDLASRCRIGFYGPRGAGKTTLINRLVGAPLLPTGDSESITAALTDIEGWDKKYYMAHVGFVMLDEWKHRVKDVTDDLKVVRVSGMEQADERGDIDAFVLQLKSLYGLARFDVHADIQKRGNELTAKDAAGVYGFENVVDPVALLPEDVLVEMQKGYISVRHDNVTSLAATLARYTHRGNRYWPVVFRITVRGPFANLMKSGVVLLDIPGAEDGDSALASLYADGVSMSDRLYYVPRHQDQLNPTTVEECLLQQGKEFGVVLTHGAKLLRTAQTDGFDMSTLQQPSDVINYVIRKLKYKTGRAELPAVKIFVVENNEQEEQANVLKLTYNEFERSELGGGRPVETALLRDFVNQVNLFFTSLRMRLNVLHDDAFVALVHTHLRFVFEARQRRTADVQAQTSKTIEDVIAPLLKSESEIRSRLEAYVDRILNPLHYRTLQSMLGDGKGEAPAHDLFPTIVAVVLDVALDTLAAATLRQDQVSREEMQTLINDVAPKSGALAEVYKPLLDSTKTHKVRTAVAIKNEIIGSIVKELKANATIKDALKGMLREGAGCRDKMVVQLRRYATGSIFIHIVTAHCATGITNSLRALWDQVNNSLTALVQKALTTITKPLEWKLQTMLPLLTNLDPDPSKNHMPVVLNTTAAAVGGPQSHAEASGMSVEIPAECKGCEAHVRVFGSDLVQLILQHPNTLMLPNPQRFNRIITRRGALSGNVYVLSNPAFIDSLYKVGYTAEVRQRIKGLFKTGVPGPFVEESKWETRDMVMFENFMHEILDDVRYNRRREFFKGVHLNVIIALGDVVHRLIDIIGVNV